MVWRRGSADRSSISAARTFKPARRPISTTAPNRPASRGANADIHTETTGREILRDFSDIGLDYWVGLAGTGGTLKGVARALRAGSPRTRIVLAEPDNAQLVGSGVLQPPSSGPAPASHPHFQPHPIQGATPDFISQLTADAVAAGYVDEVMPVGGADALRLARELATREGLFVGISAGAALAAALQVARKAPHGSTILCMLPDTGERYLSTPLFDQIATDMTDDELAISRSTPFAQFGAPPAPPSAGAPAAPAAAMEADAQADALLDEIVTEAPVALFALEWCEFCWSLRKLFAALDVPYRDVALDSVAFQKDELGLRLRRALARKAGAPTVPQLFIGGWLIGGCTDVFAAEASGALDAALGEVGLQASRPPGLEPNRLLPGWLVEKPALTKDAQREGRGQAA